MEEFLHGGIFACTFKKSFFFTFISESPSKIMNLKKKLSKLRKPFASYATFNI